MGAPIVWFEVLGKDAKKLRAFYSELFGWKLEVMKEMDYGILKNDEGRDCGGVGAAPEGAGWTTFYVKVDDLEGTLKRAEKGGAKVLMPPTTLPDGMRIAALADPEGHPVGLLSS